jgi:drug/metabolite transporter (DMT)-like permease
MRLDRGIAAGLGVVVLWASAFPAIQVAAPALGAIRLSLVRLAVATAALLTIAAIRRARVPRSRDLGWIAVAGFFGMTAYQVLLNESELHVPAGTASIIVSAAPLVSVVVARVLFRELVSPATLAGSSVALAGVAAVCLSRAGVSVSASIGIAVAAMIVQGIYHPLQRPLLRTYTGLEVATYTMVAGTLMTLPLVPFGRVGLAGASASGWVAAIYLGLLPSALGFVLWGDAVARLPVAVSTSLLYLVPPVAVLIAWLWLGEIPLPTELFGGLVVIAGVAVISQGRRIPYPLRSASRAGHRPPDPAEPREVRIAAARSTSARRGRAAGVPTAPDGRVPRSTRGASAPPRPRSGGAGPRPSSAGDGACRGTACR